MQKVVNNNKWMRVQYYYCDMSHCTRGSLRCCIEADHSEPYYVFLGVKDFDEDNSNQRNHVY